MLREVKNMRMFNSVRSAYCAVLLKGMAILWLIAVNATTLVRASPMRSCHRLLGLPIRGAKPSPERQLNAKCLVDDHLLLLGVHLAEAGS